MYRLFTGQDGESHFEDCEPEAFKVTEVSYAAMPAGRFVDWHNERRRQLVVLLSGEAEITASDGEVRRMTPGTVQLAEDLTGKGHQTKSLDGQECLWMFVALA
jgi:quercetin dioxygenase-like cupin family protein